MTFEIRGNTKIYRDVDQGSADWFRLRMGIPTASAFEKIVTPKTGKYSASARPYAFRLISERLLNMPAETVEGQRWMERGKELEPLAAKQYEFTTDLETELVSFVTNIEGTMGASPDRLIKGKAIGLEIKCPSPPVHIGYLVDGPGDDYRPQVQGQLYVGELERADFYSYHPAMPPYHAETTRDEKFIALIAEGLGRFNAEMLEMLEHCRSLGVFQAYEQAVTPAEIENAENLRDELRSGVLGDGTVMG